MMAPTTPKSFEKLYADNAQGIEIERLKMQVEALIAECDALKADKAFLHQRRGELVIERDALRNDLLPLQKFTDSVIGEFPEHGDIDWCTLQEIAVDAGLLVQVSTMVPCGESCACADGGLPDGFATECYRVQPAMKNARRAAAIDAARAAS